MRRCLELALLGVGHVAPNPMVGSVLVYTDPDTGEDRVIGEGYHERYGEKHAEANCIAAVKEEIARWQERLGVNHFVMRVQWPGLEQEKVLNSIRRLGEIFA